METWDILDSNRNKTGRTIARGEKLKEGEYHLVVHIWPINQKGKYLIQQRADHLDWFPGIWAGTGGSVLVDEESLMAAIRETDEEIGLKLQPENLILKFQTSYKSAFTDIWIIKILDADKLIIKLSPEVKQTMWASCEMIKQMIKFGIFYDYGENYFSHIFNE